jgi:hypothetical protein
MRTPSKRVSGMALQCYTDAGDLRAQIAPYHHQGPHIPQSIAASSRYWAISRCTVRRWYAEYSFGPPTYKHWQ